MLEISGRKKGRGNLKRRSMDIGNHFELEGLGKRETGGLIKDEIKDERV